MQRLEVSSAVRHIYGSLGVKQLSMYIYGAIGRTALQNLFKLKKSFNYTYS